MERKKWHESSIQQTAEALQTSIELGLKPEEVDAREKKFGRNVLSPPLRTPAWRRFLGQFENPLVIILLVSAGASFLAGRPTDGATILAVTIVNALIGFVQEMKAQSALDALAKMVKTECAVIRGNEKPFRTDASNLLPGDLVVLSTGDRVPADLRFIEAKNLQINESALTGESLPVEKTTSTLTGDLGLGDRKNLGFSGTLVTSGSGRGLVVETGDQTEIGLINALMNQTEEIQTPLMERLERFSKLFGAWVVVFGVIIFVAGLLRGKNTTDVFMAAVSAAVGAIPEGLPAVMTIVLAIGVKNMASRNAIIRKLPAVETLGSVTVICSDKTGTLTANEMTVQTLITGHGRFHAEGIGFNPSIGHLYSKENEDPAKDPELEKLLLAGILCNDSHLVGKSNGWIVEGDPTEGALLTVAAKAGLNLDELRTQNPRKDTLPFDSASQIMVTMTGNNGTTTLWLKGSAEKVIPLCSKRFLDGKFVDLDAEKIFTQVQNLAHQGMRVLALGYLPGEFKEIPSPLPQFVYVGLQAMIDPPRPEVRESLRICRQAGIRVKMITGDHPATAAAIAQDLGIASPDSPAILGKELAKATAEEMVEKAQQAGVFARVAPEHKYKLVEALQKKGEIVAMTGDGVNDAPALKRAEIGVAMGISGTEVAKDASDMILLDDNFATLVKAVEEGRNVFNNLVKSMVYILPTNTAQGMVIFFAIILGYNLPITPVQVLWVNLLTAFLSLPLAFEAMEAGLMDRKPRLPQEPLLEKWLIWRIVLVAFLMTAVSFFVFYYERRIMDRDLEAARTSVVCAMVGVEFFYLFTARTLWTPLSGISPASNPALWPCLCATIGLQLAFVYVPFFQKMMESRPIDLEAWAVLLAVAASVIPLVEGIKRLRKPEPS